MCYHISYTLIYCMSLQIHHPSVLHFGKLRERCQGQTEADRSRRKSSNQLAFVAESESRVQLRCTCTMLTKGLPSYDVNVWTRCFSKLTLLDWIYHCKYLLWWQPHIMSCGVLKPFAQRCQRRQSLRFHEGWQTGCWGARHSNRQRHYLCLNDHYAKLCKSVGDCSCNSLTSSPKTLERIWCEQEDCPVGSLFSACLLICFESLFEGKGLIEQFLASCQVPSSTILAHVMEGPSIIYRHEKQKRLRTA